MDFAILELHKGFIWVGLADNIVLKVCGSHRILDFVIRCHRFASYLSCWSTWWAILDFVLLELYKGNYLLLWSCVLNHRGVPNTALNCGRFLLHVFSLHIFIAVHRYFGVELSFIALARKE